MGFPNKARHGVVDKSPSIDDSRFTLPQGFPYHRNEIATENSPIVFFLRSWTQSPQSPFRAVVNFRTNQPAGWPPLVRHFAGRPPYPSRHHR